MKLFKKLVFTVITLLSLTVNGQEIDTVKVKYYLTQTDRNLVINLKYAQQYLDSAKSIPFIINHKKWFYKTEYFNGILKRLQNNSLEALDIFEDCLNYAKRSNDFWLQESCYYQIGIYYDTKGNSTKAINNFKKGLAIAEQNKNSKRKAGFLNSIAAVFNAQEEYISAIEYLHKAIPILEAKKDTNNLATSYTSLGESYMALKQNNNALNAFYKAFLLDSLSKSQWGLSYSYRNLGTIYQNLNNNTKAIYYYKKGLLQDKKLGLQIEKIGSYNGIAEVFHNLQQYVKSNQYIDSALFVSKATNNNYVKSRSYRLRALNYEKLNNYKRAYNSLKAYKTISDSLINTASKAALNKFQVKYETQKKEQEITKLKYENSNHQTLLLVRKRNIIILIGLSCILILIATGGWYFYKQKQKIKNREIALLKQKNEKLTLQALIKGEEKERSRLAQDLHDGINGDLSAVKLELSCIETEGLLVASQQNLTKAIQMIDASCEQIRTISHNLSPHAIQNFGLNKALQQFCTKSSNTQLKLDYQWFGEEVNFNLSVQTIIYRIIQELIFNTIKHSKASEGLVNINIQENMMYITVEDNGIGFNTQQNSTGIGLKNIASRIQYLNADLDIQSSKKGSSFLITIPLKTIPKL